MVWYSLALGAVVGGDNGTKHPGSGGHDSGAGGGNKTVGENEGYHGAFSLWGHEIWFYIGGIAGWGESFGPYVTAGPMLGRDCDFAVGGGVHISKSFGLGIVVPLRAAYNAAQHSDKVGALIQGAGQYAHQLASIVHQPGTLEQLTSGPAPILAATGMMAACAIDTETRDRLEASVTRAYTSARAGARKALDAYPQTMPYEVA